MIFQIKESILFTGVEKAFGFICIILREEVKVKDNEICSRQASWKWRDNKRTHGRHFDKRLGSVQSVGYLFTIEYADGNPAREHCPYYTNRQNKSGVGDVRRRGR